MKHLLYILALVASLAGFEAQAAVSVIGNNGGSGTNLTNGLVIKVNGTNVTWPVYLTNSATVSVTNQGGQVSFTALSGSGTVTGITNTGGGVSVINNSNSPVPILKSLTNGANITITDNGTNISIAGTGTNGFAGTNIFKGILPLTQKTRILIEGDSLSDGYNHAGAVTWSTYLTNGILFPTGLLTLATNGSLASRSLATMVANYPTYYAPQVTAPSTGTNTVYFLWGGNIDVFTGVAAATIKTYLTNLWANSRSNGAYVVAFTITDRGNGTPAMQTVRDQVNTFIRTNNSLWDYLIDVDMLIPNDRQTPVNSLSPYTYRDDDVHFTTNADRTIAVHISDVLSKPVGGSRLPYLGLDRYGNFEGVNSTVFRNKAWVLLSYDGGSTMIADYNLGNNFYGTITKDTTLIHSNTMGMITNGQSVAIWLKQDAVGTWPVHTPITNGLILGGTTNWPNNTNAGQISVGSFYTSPFTNGQVWGAVGTNSIP